MKVNAQKTVNMFDMTGQFMEPGYDPVSQFQPLALAVAEMNPTQLYGAGSRRFFNNSLEPHLTTTMLAGDPTPI